MKHLLNENTKIFIDWHLSYELVCHHTGEYMHAWRDIPRLALTRAIVRSSELNIYIYEWLLMLLFHVAIKPIFLSDVP
jgi:hypothetical protein